MQNTHPIVQFLRIEGIMKPSAEFVSDFKFVNTESLPGLGEINIFESSYGDFWVTSRNNVVSYRAPTRDSALEPLTSNEAAKISHDFILRHQPDFSQRNFISIREEVIDSRWKKEWQEGPSEPNEISIFPNLIRISVNLWTHTVGHYYCTDLRFVRTTTPKINEEAARKQILSEFEEAVIDEIKLVEQPIEGGSRARTIWFATVMTPTLTGLIPNHRSINADTGEPIPE